MASNLRVVVKPQKPWFYGNDLVKCEGVLCHLIKYLSKSINLTTDCIKVNEGGRLDERNHSWGGAMGLIQRNVKLFMVRFLVIH